MCLLRLNPIIHIIRPGSYLAHVLGVLESLLLLEDVGFPVEFGPGLVGHVVEARADQGGIGVFESLHS